MILNVIPSRKQTLFLIMNKDEISHLFQDFDSDSDSRPPTVDSDSIHDSKSHEST